jgi:hypothetical protein
MIGSLAAFGVDLNLAVVAVLAYRAISFWLPTPLGVVAYLQLRRTVSQWRQEQDVPAATADHAGSTRTAGVLG